MMLGRLLGALLLLLAAAAAAGALAAEPMPPPIVAFSLADVEVRGSSIALGEHAGMCVACFSSPPALQLHGTVPTGSSRRRGPQPLVPSPPPSPQLAEGSEFRANFEQTAEYLLLLEPDNLLFNFRWGWLGAWVHGCSAPPEKERPRRCMREGWPAAGRGGHEGHLGSLDQRAVQLLHQTGQPP